MGRKKLLSRDDVLRAIQRWIVRHGVSPTIEELRVTLKIGSSRTVLRYLEWLEEEGDIRRWPGARGVQLQRSLGVGAETVAVPIVGEAPAGPLMTAQQNVEAYVRIPKALIGASASHFLLRVRGRSMNRASVTGGTIDDGDLILVRQQATADPGDIVVALFDGEATIKRLAKGRGFYLLKPESKETGYEPILLTSDFNVQGVVKRVLKKGSELIGEK